MKSAIHKLVKSYITCQQAKHDGTKSPSLLQPLPIPNCVWQIITMDFLEGLPQSGNANFIIVVVDKLTKYTHFLTLKHP
jgi:hypothetical protein